jgi:hypothetical protein
MEQPKKNSVSKLMIILFLSLSIYEIVITFEYIFMVTKKNNFENNICIFTVINSILNIIVGVYIYNSYIKKDSKYLDLITLFKLIFNIWTIKLYMNITKCGIFKIIILIEFIIFSIGCTLFIIFFLLLFLIFSGYHLTRQPQNTHRVIINIPQTAVFINNCELVTAHVPEAYQVNISIGTRI